MAFMTIKGWHDKLTCQCPPCTSNEILLTNSPLAKKFHLPCLKHHSGSRHSAENRREKSFRSNIQFVQSCGHVWHHSGHSLSFKHPHAPHLLSEDHTGPGLCVSLPATYFRAASWIPRNWGGDTHTHPHPHNCLISQETTTAERTLLVSKESTSECCYPETGQQQHWFSR